MNQRKGILPEHNRRSLVAALLALIVLSLSGCGLFSLDTAISCDSERFYGYRATLPPTAQDVRERCSNDFNPSYEASFSLPSADLSAFQASTPITDWQTSAPEHFYFDRQAQSARSVVYGTVSDGAIFEQVLIDTSDPQTYRIYIQIVNVD